MAKQKSLSIPSSSPVDARESCTLGTRVAVITVVAPYAQGDGVAKDCDQAKILLDAAARQAKSRAQTQHVETARETLRTSGCE